MKKYICIIVAIILTLSLISCSQDRQVSKGDDPTIDKNIKDINDEGKDGNGQQPPKDTESGDPDREGDQADGEGPGNDREPMDYSSIKPNEAGQIMILMYHEIGDTESEWVRTPENFRKDLEILYNNGYRLISMKEYLNNDIHVEAGYTPVVLTFDDGSKGQFNIIEENGEFKVDPDCAVAMLEEFNKKHPDFGMASIFYVFYPVPFRQESLIQYKFEYLLERGMDIGNHSYTHENLGKLDAQDIQRVLALNVKHTQEYLPGYEVDSLALPYGMQPKDERVAYIEKGQHDGTAYHNKGVLLVGSNPAPSPVHEKYNPKRIPRVRASQINTEGVGMYDWLKYFEDNSGKRYISDGDAGTITIPEDMEEYINKEALGQKELIVYNPEQ